MLLIASYIFYGAWDWRFLSLIFISTALDYFCGLKIFESNDDKRRKLFLACSVFGNLSILGFFKYFNFFASNLQTLLSHFGISIQPTFLHIILPVGISFYTFQTLSYTIDIYRRKLRPTHHFFNFALFVAFFPQLVAGPIERAKHLLPQILAPRVVSRSKFWEGCYLICWGLFQKVFIADNLAIIVDSVFSSQSPYVASRVLIALYAFAFQILCDFAGYSNIARGLGKCMGFDIMVNFNFPYLATNPREFWQRWHISLSSWLKDYLYIPLGGNKKGSFITYRNLAITMLLGGLWHGAAWTFIAWGAYQGMLLIIHRMLEPYLKKVPLPKSRFFEKVWLSIRIVCFFHLTCLGWLIFRARSLTQIFAMLQSIYNQILTFSNVLLIFIAFLFSSFVVTLVKFKKDDLTVLLRENILTKVSFYFSGSVVFIVFVMMKITQGISEAQPFIYFQF